MSGRQTVKRDYIILYLHVKVLRLLNSTSFWPPSRVGGSFGRMEFFDGLMLHLISSSCWKCWPSSSGKYQKGITVFNCLRNRLQWHPHETSWNPDHATCLTKTLYWNNSAQLSKTAMQDQSQPKSIEEKESYPFLPYIAGPIEFGPRDETSSQGQPVDARSVGHHGTDRTSPIFRCNMLGRSTSTDNWSLLYHTLQTASKLKTISVNADPWEANRTRRAHGRLSPKWRLVLWILGTRIGQPSSKRARFWKVIYL